MKPKFVIAVRYLILALCLFSLICLIRYEVSQTLFETRLTYEDSGYILLGIIYATIILASLFVYEFQKPKNTGTWLTPITVWGFNAFTLLFSIGVFDFGGNSRAAAFFVLVLITMIINIFAFFPYEYLQKRGAKPQ
jgi:hypothetical protein